MKYEKHGWAKGKVFAHAVGLKAGPRKLLVHGAGTTSRIEGMWLVIEEPTGEAIAPPIEGALIVPPPVNTTRVPLENVAFIAEPLFLTDVPVGEGRAK